MSRNHIAALTNLNGRITESLGKYPSNRARSLLEAQRRLLKAMEGITGMRENPNSLETPSAHTLKLTKAASKLADEAKKLKAAAYDDYQHYTVSLSQAILDRGNVKESRFASEIRTAFRAVPAEQRMDFIKEIIEKVDGESFAALMQAPAILTGIDANMNRQLSEAFYLKAAPDLYQEQQDLENGMDALVASFQVIEAGASEYSDPAALRQIEQDVQRSQEAAAKFNQALGE